MDYVAEAMYYMAELKIAGWNVAAINCSFGSSNSGGLAAACNYLIAQDVMVVVAAGNGNSSSPDYLGSRGDCLDVGATDVNGNPASFSNYGSWVDIAAPGVEVMSTITDPTDPSSDYVAYMDGTSMSCPHVVGVAALLESYNPALTAAEKTAIITDPANTKAYNMTKNVGVGIVDARKCLDAAGFCDLAADFSGSPTSGCAPLLVNFTDLSTGTGIDGWSWDFGDGVGTSTAQNPSYTYNNPGTYTVSLTVSSSSQGCNDNAVKTGYINVNGGPTADFSGSPLTGTEPLTVDFTDLSTDATGWSWDFGDGVGTSSAKNPSYTYNSTGTYTVALTATNTCGSDVEQKIDYITVNPCVAPVADFSGSPITGNAPLMVSFTDLSTGNPTSWSWDFGDGVGTSSARNPSYTYNDAGIYRVTLTATNACGSDDEIKVDYITVLESLYEYAYALSDIPVYGTVTNNHTYTYASDNSYEVITEVLSTNHPRKTTSWMEHKWDFSVNATGTVSFYLEAYRSNNSDGDNFIFAYSTDDATYIDIVTVASATERIYVASLSNGLTGTVYIRVTDSNRSWDNNSLDPVYIDNMYIEYESTPGPPFANFSGSHTSGTAPLAVQFTDLSTGSPTSWSWNFGDGVGTSTDQNPQYTYNSTGTYTVSMTATNGYGSDGETKIDYITVTEIGSTMHVHDMAVGRRKTGSNYFGTCTVTIYDNLNQPVSNATVYITATGPTGGSYSDVTAADGTVYFETSGMKKPPGEWCFEVTDVTDATLTYNAGANNVTQGCESGPVYRLSTVRNLPIEFELNGYPNPFNPATTIEMKLPDASDWSITIYNITGQKVAEFNGNSPAGVVTVNWDASQKTSGIYFYRGKAGIYIDTKKMVLLK
jgi:PKD repeat protein